MAFSRLIWLLRKLWRRGILSLLAGAVFCLLWLQAHYFRHDLMPDSEGTVRVLLWNTGRIRGNVNEALKPLLDLDPDIIALVESGDVSKQSVTLPAGFQKCDIGGGLTLLAKGSVSISCLNTFGYRNRGGCCSVTLPDNEWSVLLVDLDSNPMASRERSIEQVAAMAHHYGVDLILGDFNTPLDSCSFDLLRRDYTHAFTTVGNGLHVTWPSQFPVLDVDHIWVADSVQADSAEIIKNRRSDHCMVLVDLKRR